MRCCAATPGASAAWSASTSASSASCAASCWRTRRCGATRRRAQPDPAPGRRPLVLPHRRRRPRDLSAAGPQPGSRPLPAPALQRSPPLGELEERLAAHAAVDASATRSRRSPTVSSRSASCASISASRPRRRTGTPPAPAPRRRPGSGDGARPRAARRPDRGSAFGTAPVGGAAPFWTRRHGAGRHRPGAGGAPHARRRAVLRGCRHRGRAAAAAPPSGSRRAQPGRLRAPHLPDRLAAPRADRHAPLLRPQLRRRAGAAAAVLRGLLPRLLPPAPAGAR